MSVCESSERRVTDTENTDTVHVASASMLDAETVQNSPNVRSCHVEEETPRDRDLLKGMLTDTFCQVCEAVLLFDSQRVSHYEGKKHAQRVRIYLQTKKAERSRQRHEHGNVLSMKDPEKFCELCNMVFSSPVVAKSHYEGKVHAKNTRKASSTPSVDSKTSDSKTSTCPSVVPVPTEEDTKHKDVDPGQKESAESAVQGVDLSDPDKYCKLCAASFNNPAMAQQHYSGRKHQRNRTRKQLLDQLSETSEHASALTCPLCCVTLDSIEMYQNHMQSNKHYVTERKITGLCKKKVYDSFQDELADYIQVQRARGLGPKMVQASEVQGQGIADEQERDSEECEEEPPVAANPSHLPRPAFRPQRWRPPLHPRPNQTAFRARFPVHQQWDQGSSTYPPPLIPGLTGRSLHKWKRLDSSSSSSISDSSSSSYSSSSSSSDSSSSEGRRRKRRKRREGTERRREAEDSVEGVERRRSKKKRTREGQRRRRRGESSEKEQRRRRERKRPRERVSKEREGYDEGWSKAPDEETTKGEEAALNESGLEEPTLERTEPKEEKPKHRKDKKKTKDPGDNRTEEEKLWDETILGIF